MPLASLRGEKIDGMVVGGIGGGALSKLQAAGIRVYLSDLSTVEATVSALKAGSLREVTPGDACVHRGGGPHGHGPHGHGGGAPHWARHGCGSQRS
jgi:predicted Fe-Mo cluster-binding NifX family protein